MPLAPGGPFLSRGGAHERLRLRKSPEGTLLMVLGWLGLVVGTALFGFAAMMSGCGGPAEPAQKIQLAAGVLVLSVLAIVCGWRMQRGPRR